MFRVYQIYEIMVVEFKLQFSPKYLYTSCITVWLHISRHMLHKDFQILYSKIIYNNFTQVHPVNLALLQQFCNDSKLLSVFGDTTFIEPVNVLLPGFKMYEHNFNQFLVDDSKAHLNVTKMVQAAKNDSLIFQSLAEPLLDGMISLDSEWPDVNAILIFITMPIAVLSFIACIWSFYKIRKLVILVTALQQISSAKSVHVKSGAPSFIYNVHNQPTTTENPMFEGLQTDFGWNHVSVLLSTLVICILFSMVFYHWYQSRNRKCTKIVLELTTGGECLLVPVLNLPLCPSFWHITPPTDIFNVRIESSHFSHKLCLDWPGFEIANVSNTNTVGVKCSFPLSWYQKYVISKILQQPFDIHILVVHHEMYYPLPHDKSNE